MPPSCGAQQRSMRQGTEPQTIIPGVWSGHWFEAEQPSSIHGKASVTQANGRMRGPFCSACAVRNHSAFRFSRTENATAMSWRILSRLRPRLFLSRLRPRLFILRRCRGRASKIGWWPFCNKSGSRSHCWFPRPGLSSGLPEDWWRGGAARPGEGPAVCPPRDDPKRRLFVIAIVLPLPDIPPLRRFLACGTNLIVADEPTRLPTENQRLILAPSALTLPNADHTFLDLCAAAAQVFPRGDSR